MYSALEFIKTLWRELDTVIELFVYLTIAYGMHLLFSITFIQAIIIVFAYFLLSILRIIVEIIRNRIR